MRAMAQTDAEGGGGRQGKSIEDGPREGWLLGGRSRGEEGREERRMRNFGARADSQSAARAISQAE